jgi:hypothetical protein
VGKELAEKVQQLCATNSHLRTITFKTAEQWGVVLDSDIRLTAKQFGDYKSTMRKVAEQRLLDYMLEPSRTRGVVDTAGDYQIAITMAPPGTGKSRFLDDAMRMPLKSPHVDHFLRFAITFNGKTSGAFKYPISARVLFQFFCTGKPAEATLDAIDEMLFEHFHVKDEDQRHHVVKGEVDVSHRVFNAVEALYFHQRNSKLGRTVLMIDEISKASSRPQTTSLC